MPRALIVVSAMALVIVPAAGAWSWPVNGPVLQKFVLGDDPYAAGQHRGIDIGGPSGTTVAAPASGYVSFVGTVPVSGRAVTIQTTDGYSVTLTHLGSTTVRRGETVTEGAVVGMIGPSGEVEHDVPYLHLGIRRSEDPNGYVDPLLFLPAKPVPVASPSPAPPAVATPAPPPTPSSSAPPTATATAPPSAMSAPAGSSVSTAADETRSAGGAAFRGRGASSVAGAGVRSVPSAQDAAPPPVRAARLRRATRRHRPQATRAETRAAQTSKPVRSASERERERSAVSKARSTIPGRGGSSGPTKAAAGTERNHSRFPTWVWLSGLLPIAAAIALIRRRTWAAGARKPAPIIDSNVALLPDNPDLLRELDPAHRARVHDDRRRHPGATSSATRQRDVLPDRERRERIEERASCRRRGRGPEGVRRSTRRGALAPSPGARRRVRRLLHTNHR
jgi:hypothetical protein